MCTEHAVSSALQEGRDVGSRSSCSLGEQGCFCSREQGLMSVEDDFSEC